MYNVYSTGPVEARGWLQTLGVDAALGYTQLHNPQCQLLFTHLNFICFFFFFQDHHLERRDVKGQSQAVTVCFCRSLYQSQR